QSLKIRIMLQLIEILLILNKMLLNLKLHFYNNSPQIGSLYQAKQKGKKSLLKLNVITNRINKLLQEEIVLQKKAEDLTNKANYIFEKKKQIQQKKEQQQKKKIIVEEIPFTHPKGQLNMLKCQIAKQFQQEQNKEKSYNLKHEIAELYSKKSMEDQILQENLKWKVSQVKQQQQISKQKQLEYKQRKLETVLKEKTKFFKENKNNQNKKKKYQKSLNKQK
ncbi:hypothetical protein IMG5_145500, partial [Ichthyophthirius multifiliis]